ncbi:MAG TPA: M28 family peptidase, partial [Phycisphaerales bacterium]|nr:M28 family peptidase [Phycisphaerales bacterium]
NMGLGLYGGLDYDQGFRNRDGWDGPGTLGNQETRLYLSDMFTDMGLDVTIQGSYSNVVGELKGTGTPENIYLIGAHYDTYGSGERPGGDDNASGTAGVLEAARVLSQYSFDSTIRFIGFNAEEDWMKGSQDYVDNVITPNNEMIMGMINLDMILRPGWDGEPDQPYDLDIITKDSPECLDWADAFITAAGTYAPSLELDSRAPDTSYWSASDQEPFISAGFPALFAAENTANEIWGGSNDYYHQFSDASDGLANDPFNLSGITYDYAFATDVVRTAVATLATEAIIVPEPTSLLLLAIGTVMLRRKC